MASSTAVSSQSIREALEEDIIKGLYNPGSKLDEASLCERFDVSRTPIREALRSLSSSGLVELVPNRGAFVSEISIPSLVEMFEVMAELEGMCGRLSARRMTKEEQEDLKTAHEDCIIAEDNGETDDYYHSNERFHDVIYQGCHNEFLIEQVKFLRRRLQPYRRMQLQVPRRMNNSLQEHESIVEAIVSGDEQRAEQSLRDHLVIQGERFNDFVAMMMYQKSQ